MSTTQMQGDKFEAPPKVLISCTHCRASKVQCSNQRPCPRCLKKGLECVNAPTTRKRRPSRRASCESPVRKQPKKLGAPSGMPEKIVPLQV
eukprot:EC690668.1.p4 GENE.EC690668.1~~EC690668.1.p4  ORF type:complete len:91 (+),score=12.00 EC690668.1:137-409(+)